ncbi:ORF4 [Sugarcane umbra-like virus]|nr:ORF4 [Sugarcane umbra-like virus]
MANTTQRGIRLRKRVVRRRPRRSLGNPAWRTAGLPFAPATSQTVRTGTVLEANLPMNSVQLGQEAVAYTVPLNLTGIPSIKDLATNPLYYRITSVMIAMEPALSTSTQICGVGNADYYTTRTYNGFGNVFKKMRTLHFSKRSTPGGNVQVKWPINMEWVKITDTNTLTVPQLFFAVTNPGVIETKAGEHESWFEFELAIQYIIGG